MRLVEEAGRDQVIGLEQQSGGQRFKSWVRDRKWENLGQARSDKDVQTGEFQSGTQQRAWRAEDETPDEKQLCGGRGWPVRWGGSGTKTPTQR